MNIPDINVSQIVYLLLFAAIAPAVDSVHHRWQARQQQRRRGKPLLQPYRDLIKLWRKEPIVPPSPTSWIYLLTHWLSFACYLLLGWAYLSSSTVDMLTAVYLLGFARFAQALAGWDSGTPFSGLGGSRELFIGILAEPALILLALIAVSLSPYQSSATILATIFLSLAAAMLMLAEAGRLPADNPSSHLELTMIAKGTHLPYAGRHLALLRWGEAMKLTFFLLLLADLWLPRDLAPSFQFIRLLIPFVGAVVLAVIENRLLKWQLRKIPLLLTMALGAAFTAILIAYVGGR